MSAPAGAPPAGLTPPGGDAGGGGQSAQLVQQIEALLAQLAQEQPNPQVQQIVQAVQKPIEALQQVVGTNDAQNMQSGLANPGGGGAGGPGSEDELPPPATGGHEGAGGGGEHHVVEVHIGVPSGGPKSFGGAKKAAMAQHAASGHFDPNTPKGETPSTPKTKSKAKG